MSVAHEYTLIIQWSEEDGLYLAYSPELPGCITHGRTYVEAAEMGVEAMELWCETTQAAGEALPAPIRYDASRLANFVQPLLGSKGRRGGKELALEIEPLPLSPRGVRSSARSSE